MNFDKLYQKILILQQITDIPKYINKKIGILAGNFRIPYQYDIDLINQYLKFCDLVIIDISNTSKDTISERTLAKTNIQPLAKIFSKIKTDNNKINELIFDLKENIEKYSYKEIKAKLQQLLLLLKDENIKEKIQKYMNRIEDRLYSSIIYYNNNQITAQMVKKIFQILLENKINVEIKISQQISPVLDVIDFVNNNCEKCEIYIQTLDGKQNSVWKNLKQKFQKKNHILEYYSQEKAGMPRKFILDDLNILKQLNSDHYDQILDVLNGDDE